MIRCILNVLAILALLAFNSYAADLNGKKIPNLESTIMNNETVLKYESYDLGTISGSLDVKFTAMVITDPIKSNVVAAGMKVTIIADKNTASSVYLDADEVKGLSEALTLIKSISEKYATEKKEPYTEVMFSSKGDFKFGYINKGAGAGMFESGSSLFFRTPALESILKDDDKRFGIVQSTIANALFKISNK